MTQEELKMILHQSSEQGVIDKDETEMLRDVFRFSDKRANDLMTYRRDIVALHRETPAKRCCAPSANSTSANTCWWRRARTTSSAWCR